MKKVGTWEKKEERGGKRGKEGERRGGKRGRRNGHWGGRGERRRKGGGKRKVEESEGRFFCRCVAFIG